MPLRAKVVAVSMMAASLVYVVFFAALPTWLVVIVGVLVLVGVIVVLRVPHRAVESVPRPPEARSEPQDG